MSEGPLFWDRLTGEPYKGEAEPVSAEDLKNALIDGITTIIAISEQMGKMIGIEKEKKEPGKLSRSAAIDLLKAFTVDEKGLKFGIWIEHEMVNPRSELAERPPDWVIQSPDREKYTFRNQWVLDLSNPEECDFIWNTIDQ